MSWHTATVAGQPLSPTAGGAGTDTEPEGPAPARPWYRKLGIAVAAVFIGSTFLVWIYALSGQARRDPPDLLDDPTFALRAEPICDAVYEELAELPGALDAVDGPDRGRQVVASTGRLETMIDELRPHVSGTERDIEITTAWLADWSVLIEDRYRYAEAVTDDPASPFLITDLSYNEGLERRITRFATTNDMGSCGAPGDLG